MSWRTARTNFVPSTTAPPVIATSAVGKLARKNYDKAGRRGAWHVEHSRAKANGGTNRRNNLYAACIQCNLDKGTRPSRTVRRWHGRRRAPLSRRKRKDAKRGNAVKGGVAGAVLGSLLGPWGTVGGLLLGAKAGFDANPDVD